MVYKAKWPHLKGNYWSHLSVILFFISFMLTACKNGSIRADENERNFVRTSKKTKQKEHSNEPKVHYYVNSAHTVAASGEWEIAIVYLDSALTFAASNIMDSIYQFRAYCNTNRHNYREAIIDYNKIILNQYNLKENYFNRAELHLKRHHIRQAVRDLRLAIVLGNSEAEKLHNKINPEKKKIMDYVTLCCDGTSSSSKGKGACSHHGGVCNWNEPVYKVYRKY